MKTNTKQLKTSVLVASIALLFAGNAMAVTNGNFSNGLTGWSTLGDVKHQFGSVALTNASSIYEDDFPELAGAFNASGNDVALAAVAGGIEEFSGLPLGTLDLNAIDAAFEGSVIKQTFNVNAGDTLSFNWNFFTNEAPTGNDYAFIVINGVVTLLANPTMAMSPSVGFAFTTGYQSFSTGMQSYSQSFSSATSVTLAFGVVDVADAGVSSALWIDNVAVVPEPDTYAMLLAGFGLIGFTARHRKNK